LLQILISVIVGWLVSFLLTSVDVLSADKGDKQFYARTDMRLSIIEQAPWFAIPYPGELNIIN
jgi:nucleobase transporter 1/2